MAGLSRRLPFNALTAAVFTRLQPALSAISVGVYSPVSPQGALLPFAVVNQARLSPSEFSGKQVALWDTVVTIEIVFAEESFALLNDAMTTIVSALTMEPIVLSDGFRDTDTGDLESANVFAESSDEDGVIVHGVVNFQYQIEDQQYQG